MGLVRYLALLPQINKVGTVESLDASITEMDALEQFSGMEPIQDPCTVRCWINTHPRYKALMSSTDIYQLYGIALTNRSSFGIVISPRMEGVKALCVHLTDEGFNWIDNFVNYLNRTEKNLKDYKSKVISFVDECSRDMKFYCQIPFTISYDECQLLDFWSNEKVVGRLTEFVSSNVSDHCWI